MNRTLVVEQPNYIPWLGYFDLIRQSDVWIWYDDVQYTKRDWRNRNRVAGDGAPVWLTIPVKTKGRFAQAIRDVEIDDDQPWRKRHLGTLRRCYARAPHGGAVLALVERAFAASYARLADLTIDLNESICASLGFAPRFLRSSALAVSGERQERLLRLCELTQATTYLSGPAARDYLDPHAFERASIELRYIVYDYPPYARGAQAFVPRLSILHALAWLGAEQTAAYLAAHSRSEAAGVLC
jgi:hypothetical protein